MECNIILSALPILRVCCFVGRDHRIVLLADCQQLVFGHDVLARRFHVVLMDTRLDDGINRTGFLTEATINTFKQIDVVARCATRTVVTDTGLDCDSQCRTYGLAKLTGDASLFAVRVTTQSMQPTEARRLWRLLFRVFQRNALSKPVALRDRQAFEQLPQSERLDVADYLIHRLIRPCLPMDLPGTTPSHLRRQS